jgi:hypothetical protein
LSEKERTSNVSLRISESAYKALQEDSKKRNVSLNTFTNQVLRTYSEYDRLLASVGIIKISRPVFAQILGGLPDNISDLVGKENFAEIAGSDPGPGLIVSTEGELSASSITKWMRRVGVYSGMFEYREIVHGGKVVVTLSHDLGPKWSLLLSEYYKALFRSAGIEVKPTRRLDSVTIEYQA